MPTTNPFSLLAAMPGMGWLKQMVGGRGAERPPAPLPPPPVCAAQDFVPLLLLGALAAALALRSDRARPSTAAAAAVLPALVGAWWCHGGRGSAGADEDRALAFVWSLVGLAFVGVFCAAMLGVRDTVRERDLERAMTDTLSLFVSFAPAGHTALLWLSQGPAACAAAVAVGQAGAALGAASRWLRLPARLQQGALVAGFLAACALAAQWQSGYLCLVAWYSASMARAYEVGLRSLCRCTLRSPSLPSRPTPPQRLRRSRGSSGVPRCTSQHAHACVCRHCRRGAGCWRAVRADGQRGRERRTEPACIRARSREIDLPRGRA